MRANSAGSVAQKRPIESEPIVLDHVVGVFQNDAIAKRIQKIAFRPARDNLDALDLSALTLYKHDATHGVVALKVHADVRDAVVLLQRIRKYVRCADGFDVKIADTQRRDLVLVHMSDINNLRSQLHVARTHPFIHIYTTRGHPPAWHEAKVVEKFGFRVQEVLVRVEGTKRVSLCDL
jgi:hypothetical protein